MPRWVQNRASSEAITVRGSTGAICASGTTVRSTRLPETQRASIRVETGSTTRYSGASR